MDTNKIATELNSTINISQQERRSKLLAQFVRDDIKEFVTRNLPSVKALIQNSEGGLLTQDARYVRIDWDYQLDTYQTGWISLLLGIYAELNGVDQDVYFDYKYSGISVEELTAKKYSLKAAIETIFSGKDVEVAKNGAEVNPMN